MHITYDVMQVNFSFYVLLSVWERLPCTFNASSKINSVLHEKTANELLMSLY